MWLGKVLVIEWDSRGATAETKKKIIRLLIAEIVVNISDTLKLIIHWQGGDHTELTVKKNNAGHNRWVTDADVVNLVAALARQMPDESIAAVVNRISQATSPGPSCAPIRSCFL